MSRLRSAAILLVILMALLAAAGGAAAAGGLPALGPMLTPNPPVALPSAPPPPAPAPAPHHAVVRRAAVTTAPTAPPAATALPRTGLDAGFEALLGALLIVTGAVLKARDPAARRLAGASYVELDPVPVGQLR